MALDVVTLMIIATAIEFTAALLLIVFLKSSPSPFDPRSSRSMRAWCLSHLLCGLGFVAILFRGVAPDWFTFVLGNAVLLVGIDLRRIAIAEFWGTRPLRSIALIAPTLWIAISFTPFFELSYAQSLATLHSFMFLVAAWISSQCFAANHEGLKTAKLLAFTLAAAAITHLYVVLSAIAPNILFIEPYSSFKTIGGYLTAICITLFTTAILVFAKVIEREKNRFQKLAQVDSLTGIKNRRAFLNDASSWLSTHRAASTDFAVIMIDLDHFKTVNDKFGHETGDQVLKIAAETLQAALPENAIAGRIGGEEFAILLPMSGNTRASSIAETIRDHFTKAVSVQFNRVMGVTLSAGLHVSSSTDCTLEAAMRQADQALYDAKKAGRNSIYCSKIGHCKIAEAVCNASELSSAKLAIAAAGPAETSPKV